LSHPSDRPKCYTDGEVQKLIELAELGKHANGARISLIQIRVTPYEKLQAKMLADSHGETVTTLLLRLLKREANRKGYYRHSAPLNQYYCI